MQLSQQSVLMTKFPCSKRRSLLRQQIRGQNLLQIAFQQTQFRANHDHTGVITHNHHHQFYHNNNSQPNQDKRQINENNIIIIGISILILIIFIILPPCEEAKCINIQRQILCGQNNPSLYCEIVSFKEEVLFLCFITVLSMIAKIRSQQKERKNQ